mgnify:FL=1|jgi:hypothetical protein
MDSSKLWVQNQRAVMLLENDFLLGILFYDEDSLLVNLQKITSILFEERYNSRCVSYLI